MGSSLIPSSLVVAQSTTRGETQPLARARRQGLCCVGRTRGVSDDEYVMEATEEDLRIAVARALEHCGLTWDELEAQGRSGDFESVSARIAWVAVGDLGHLA